MSLANLTSGQQAQMGLNDLFEFLVSFMAPSLLLESFLLGTTCECRGRGDTYLLTSQVPSAQLYP